ncbi:MAG: hypothetical protein ICV68_14540 [Pyrinomonadaceae bacterium]|nr:hypothetical protein [Pyrinomonadaceae bacterium]
MPRRRLALSITAIFLLLLSSPASIKGEVYLSLQKATRVAAQVPAPEDVLGFRPGDDRKLASWASVVDYFRKLDAASERVKFEELGRTTMNAPFVMGGTAYCII